MSYTGEILTISGSQGGFTGSKNTSEIASYDMVDGTKNINLHNGVREKRGGTTKITAELDSGARIYGLFDYLKPAGSQYIVFATSTKIWKDASNTIKTGWTASKYVWFNQFAGELYACNGADTPGKWDGTTWTDLTNIPTDWGTSKPKYMVTHGRGNSERNWAFGCASTPYYIYVSPDGDGDDFSDANVTTLSIDTKDGYGVVAAIPWLDQLIAFGRKRAYIIDDSDTNTANWGYVKSPWFGGAAHQKLVVETPNDLVVIDENMEIYSLRAAQQYGDYKAASIARPSFIHTWIKDNVREAYIADFHAVYDRTLRAIKIFVVRNGQTEIDTALVYFIDRGPKAGWIIHDNQNNASGYDASIAAEIYVGAGDYQVYTGDYSGFIWGLENSNKNDDSKAYDSGYKTGDLDMGNPRSEKHFRRGRLIVDPQGTETLNVAVYIDSSQIDTPSGAWAISTPYTVGTIVTNDAAIYECTTAHTSSATDEPGTGASWTSYWKQHRFSMTVASGTKDYTYDIGAKGKRIQREVYCDTVSEDYVIEEDLLDFKPLGAEPE